MIGKISGILAVVKPPLVLIETPGGIGYEIDIPMSDFYNLPTPGSELTLYTHLVIREDHHALFGFISPISKDCFRQLIKVSGIGPKIGLALLSTLSVEDIHSAVACSDITTLCLVPGVGKKMAERMLLELKGKLGLGSEFASAKGAVFSRSTSAVKNDILTALISLGYNEKDTLKVIHQLPEEINDISFGIKEALKLITKTKSL